MDDIILEMMYQTILDPNDPVIKPETVRTFFQIPDQTDLNDTWNEFLEGTSA